MKSNNFIIVIIALVCATLFTYYNLELSKKIGRLSTVTSYDDVVYLSNAADLYFTFKNHGCLPGLNLLFTKNLHAPFTVLDAFFGYVVFGFNTDCVYYSQIAVLLTYLFFVTLFTRRLKLNLRIAILLSALAVPFASLCVLVFRPDQMSGIVVAGIAVTILTSGNLFNKKWKGVLLGIGLGSALLIKSSTFALILLVISGSWLLTAFRMLILRKCSFANILLSGGLTILTTILISGWYWFRHGKELWAYFIDNSFGVNADVWRSPGGIKEHLFYYFKGETLQSSLGFFTIPLAILLLGGCLHDLLLSRTLERKIIGGGILWMVACIFGIYFFQGIKNQYMGGVLYMFLLFGALGYLEIILRNRLSSGAILWNWFSFIVIALSLSMYRFPLTERVNNIFSKNSKSTTLGILTDISKYKSGDTISILFTQGGPVIPEYIDMILKSKSIKIKRGSAALTKSYKDVLATLQEYNYVVVQDPEIEGRPGFPMPAEIWEEQLKSDLDESSQWLLINKYTSGDGKSVYLYSKKKLL